MLVAHTTLLEISCPAHMLNCCLCSVVKIHIKLCCSIFTENWRKHFTSVRVIITGPCLIKVFLNFEYIMLFCETFLGYTVTYKRGDMRSYGLNLFPSIHNNRHLPSHLLCTLVAFIANNMKPDQTAALGAV